MNEILTEIFMARFDYSVSNDDEDRAYVRVDEVFDIHVLRTEEGLITDVYDTDRTECLATIALPEDSIAHDEEERP
jgi:hypothetical protein